MDEEKKNSKRPRIRTMITDAQEYLKGGKISLVELLAQRKDQKEGLYPERARKKSRIIILGIAAFFVFALFSAGAFFLGGAIKAPRVEEPSSPKSLIPASMTEMITIEGRDPKIFLQEWRLLFKKRLGPREFLAVTIFDKAQNTFLGPKELFSLLSIAPPPLFLSSLSGPMTVGVMDTPRGNESIFIFRVRAFSEAFAGMLAWENNLPKDVGKLLSQEISLDRGSNVFHDIVVLNHDARVLENQAGDPIFIYTIFNRQFLILAQSQAALETTLRQLSFFPPQ